MAFPLIIFLQIWTHTGYSTVIFLAGLQAIPKELLESARVDGAGAWAQFKSVTIPLIAQAITVNVLLAIIGALRTFDTIYVATNGQYDTYTLAFYMFRLAFISEGGSGRSGGRLGFASAAATILFLIILVVSMIAQRYLRKKEVEL
jgi:raffinose/stachyose/melibiose transport system permease protein